LPARLADVARHRQAHAIQDHPLAVGETMLRVGLPIEVRRKLDQRAEALLALPDRRLRLLELRDVARIPQQMRFVSQVDPRAGDEHVARLAAAPYEPDQLIIGPA